MQVDGYCTCGLGYVPCLICVCVLQGMSAAGVTSAGAITMQQCEIIDPGPVGIGVVGQGVAMVRRCGVKNAADCGILVQDQGR